MVAESAFADLRRLADWFATSPQRTSLPITRLVQRLGATAVPLLGRELRSADPRRREASRGALATLATDPAARPRVIAELRAITGGASDAAGDETKVCALGLLAELGERAAAQFSDPGAIQQRSAIALASQLATEADVASAADLMIQQLADGDIVQMLEVMVEAAPHAAHRLAAELAVRLDLPAESRERIAATVLGDGAGPAPVERRKPPRPTHVAVLVDASARIVVVASRKVSGERRWRRWAVLIGASGRIEDCLHEDDPGTTGDAAPLIASLCADGYRVASTDVEHARTVVATAARLTALSPRLDARGRTTTLSSAYYLGRDLLDLRDAHLGGRPPQGCATVARAVEHLAAGDHERALALLSRCDPDHPDAAATLATIHLARKEPAEAARALERALAVEPEWPLHHWNLAIALHQLGDASGCFHALRRFLATSAHPTGLAADPLQPGRVATAERMIAELERLARVTGIPLRRRRRRAGPVRPSAQKPTPKKSRARR